MVHIPVNTNTKLVRGFLTQKDSDGNNRHVAEYSNGSVKISRPVSPNCQSFNWGTLEWETIDYVPAGCEYIGLYPANM